VSECGSTGFIEDLVRLPDEAAADDFFLDLGGAAEDQLDVALLGQWCLFDDNAEPIGPGKSERSIRTSTLMRSSWRS
jgi:hypothetical protein